MKDVQEQNPKVFVLYGDSLTEIPPYLTSFKSTTHPLKTNDVRYRFAQDYKTLSKTVMLNDSTKVDLVVVGFYGFSLKDTPIPISVLKTLPPIDLLVVPRIGETALVMENDTLLQKGSFTTIDDLKKINKSTIFDYTTISDLDSLESGEKSIIRDLLENRPTTSDSSLVSDKKTRPQLSKEELKHIMSAEEKYLSSDDDDDDVNSFKEGGCNIF